MSGAEAFEILSGLSRRPQSLWGRGWWWGNPPAGAGMSKVGQVGAENSGRFPRLRRLHILSLKKKGSKGIRQWPIN